MAYPEDNRGASHGVKETGLGGISVGAILVLFILLVIVSYAR